MESDKRASLRLKSNRYRIPMSGVSTNLKDHGQLNQGQSMGVVFPYTPTITYSRSVNYGSYDLAHTNYQPKFYSNTASPDIQLTALFTNNTEEETRYTAGALNFLRTCSLMHFGENDEFRGTPPPVILFSAYGVHQFEDFPVVISNVSYTLDSDQDYIETKADAGSVILPAQMFIAISLIHQPNLIATRKNFTLQGLANGSLLGQGFI